YDEVHHVLQGQVPFVGIPDHFINMYMTEIAPDSPASKVWISQATLIIENAPQDPQLTQLGLAHLAQAVGIQNTILTPLALGGNALGYLQAANKKNAAPFTEEDIRILAIISGQAAPIIQNAKLIQETRRRAQQAEALRKIAALAGSAATLDEILKYSLIEISRLLHVNSGVIFLLDDERYELSVHKESIMGISSENIARFPRIYMDDPIFRNYVTISQHIVTYGLLNQPGATPEFYENFFKAMSARSAISVPLIVRDRGIGEILLSSKEENFFSQADIELALTTAGQVAGAIERSSLYTQTDESLRRRVEQLTSLTRISQELNSSLDLKHLLKLVYNEAVYNTGADCGSIFLFDLDEPFTNLPKIAFQVGDVNGSQLLDIEQIVVNTGAPLIIPNFTQSEHNPPHPGIITSLIVPIGYQDHIVGLVHMHARTPQRFDQESVEIAQTLAVQAAIALGNAQRYHEQVQRNIQLNQGMEILAKLLETSQALRENQPIEKALTIIAEGIQEATTFEVVLISIFDEQIDALRRITSTGIPPATMKDLIAHTVPWRQIQELLSADFQIHHSYFIPEDKSPILPPEIHSVSLLSTSETNKGLNGNAWHPDDALLVPLYHQDNKTPLGLISVDAPRNGLRPDRTTVEALEIFATQAALTIERHTKIDSLRTRVDSLEGEVTRAQHASKLAQTQLPFLLHKDLEQTLSIQRLNLRSRRIQAILEIIEAINRETNRDGIFRALGEALIRHMEVDVVLITEPTRRGPVLSHALGKIPDGTNPQALLGQRNPLRHCLRNNIAIFAANMATVVGQEWQGSPLLAQMKTESFFCFPVTSPTAPNTAEAAILGLSFSPVSEFTTEDQQIFSLVADEIAITLQNLTLLEETRQRLREVDLLLDFSRQLGSLNPDEIMRSLVESVLRVVIGAQAAMIALWEPKQGHLRPQAVSGYKNQQRIMEITYRLDEALPGQVFAEGTPRRVDEVDFARDYNISTENLLRYQEATAGYVPLSSMLIPIRAGEEKLGIIVLDNFTTNAAFSEEDQALITSLVQQTGLILENARLFQAAEQRAHQLQALTSVSTTITSNLQVDTIIVSLLEQLQSVIPFETGTFWLRQGNFLTIQAAQGFEDNEDRVGLKVVLEDSRLLNEMIITGQAIHVPDVNHDDRFPAWIEYKFLSWVGIPLLSKGEVVGVIALEKQEAGFYTAEHIQAATTFAGQAAVALENARLFEESQQRTEELNERTKRLDMLNRLSTRFSASLDAEEIIAFTLEQIGFAIQCSVVSAVTLDENGKPFLVKETPSFSSKAPTAFEGETLLAHLRESGGAFIASDVTTEPLLASLKKYFKTRKTQAVVALPLIAGKELHGLILIHSQQEGFQTGELELATTITNQAAVALGNARLFEKTQTTLENLEIRERYQKNVALAVVSLNERGSQALDEAMQLMGDVSQASRVYYFEAVEDAEGIFWRQTAEWRNPKSAGDVDHQVLQQFPATVSSFLSVGTEESGLFAGLVKDLPAGPRALLEQQNILSILILAVPGELSIPGYLAFIETTYERIWRTDEMAALQTVAAGLSSTMSQEKLLKQVQAALAETEEQTRRLTLLNEMSAQLSRASTATTIFEISATITRQIINTDQASVAISSPDGTSLTIFTLSSENTSLTSETLPIDKSLPIRQAIQTRQPLLMHESRAIPLADIKSFIVVPLLTRDAAIGTINVGSKLAFAFTQSDLNMLVQIASLVSATLENKNLLEETRRLTEELEERVRERTYELEIEHNRTQTLLRIITELSSSLDMDIVLTRTLEQINKIVEAEQSTIMLSRSTDTFLLRRASYGYTSPTPAGGEVSQFSVNEGLAGWVIAYRESALIPDLTTDHRWVRASDPPEAISKAQHRSAIAVPLLMGEETLGALLLFHREFKHFSEDHLDLVQATAKQIAVAINNAQLYGLIRDQAERLGSMLRNQQVEASRLRAILEAVADGVLVTEASGIISVFNASATQILDLGDAQLVGKSLDNFIGLFGKAGQLWTDTIRAWSEDPGSAEAADFFSEEITLDNGRVVAVSLSPVSTRSEFLGTVSIFRDITHQVEVDRLKSEFVATVSHELRTPMTSIRGYTDILLMGAAGALNDQQKSFLSVVKSNTERLNILVNDLLDISRIEAGKVSLNMQAVQLIEAATNVVQEFIQRAKDENKPMTFEIVPPSFTPSVLGDVERIRQIFENLVENAYLYTPVDGKVIIRFSKNHEFVQTDVRDTGIGIAPEDQDRIFERFYRGEDPLVLASAGTGLGLPIVRYLIERHGGKLWMDSQGIPGQGSVFSFTLPLYEPED
ncbi:MAG: GAF domain-containing protein, partial [Anaerolineales bacterium]|nr:GAF domain-containing protein [Anaerolineales bacterium]